MRRLAVICLFGLIASCTSGPRDDDRVESVALTTNLDFEGGSGEEGRPTDWLGGGEGYELAVDSAEKHEGASSGRIRLVAEQADPNAFGTMSKCTNAGPLTESKIAYAGYLKTSDVVGWSGLWFRVDGPREDDRPQRARFRQYA